jgi:hypothetical protein
MNSKNTGIDQPRTTGWRETAPVVVSMWGNARMRIGPTAEATARWTSERRTVKSTTRTESRRKNNALDRKVADLMTRLYFDAKCGNAAAEYNLEKAGMIEMIFDQVAGEMRWGDNFWNDLRWMLTELGRRTKLIELKRIILRDPPLDIALRDAEYEATDVAERCWDPEGLGYVMLHNRILIHLDERVERIRAAQNSGL